MSRLRVPSALLLSLAAGTLAQAAPTGVTESTGPARAAAVERPDHTLRAATAAEPSGACLFDARLRIVEAASESPLLRRTREGPWFFADLPAGRFEVSAALAADGWARAQTFGTPVTVLRGGQRQAVVRLDSSADVSPDMERPSHGNPLRVQPGVH